MQKASRTRRRRGQSVSLSIATPIDKDTTLKVHNLTTVTKSDVKEHMYV